MPKTNRFRHESLQNKDSIKSYLEALTKAIGKGKVVLEEDDGTLVLEPEGLVHFKVTGAQEDAHNRLTIRLSWQSAGDVPKKKSLKIS